MYAKCDFLKTLENEMIAYIGRDPHSLGKTVFSAWWNLRLESFVGFFSHPSSRIVFDEKQSRMMKRWGGKLEHLVRHLRFLWEMAMNQHTEGGVAPEHLCRNALGGRG